MQISRSADREAEKTICILNRDGSVLFYNSERKRSQLGSLQREILQLLYFNPMTGSDLARTLKKHHQQIYQALGKLREKGLITGSGFIGANLAGVPFLRIIYNLNPETVNIAQPVAEPTKAALKVLADEVQQAGILRQKTWNVGEKMRASTPMKQIEGAIEMERLVKMIIPTHPKKPA